MLIVGIIAFIVVIVVVAYKYKSLLDKKEEENKKRLEGIKDGKYILPGNPQAWIIVLNNKVEIWVTERNIDTYKEIEFFITPNNDQTKVNIDGEELYTYMSTNRIDNQNMYLAQSSSGKIVFYNRNSDLVLTPIMTFVKEKP